MGRREVIVCVDDEEGVLRVLRAQLGTRFGHECQVLTARSGDDVRLGLAGVAPIPWSSLDGATPLPGNEYKTKILDALVRRARAQVTR